MKQTAADGYEDEGDDEDHREGDDHGDNETDVNDHAHIDEDHLAVRRH